jgi:hypothetical protein
MANDIQLQDPVSLQNFAADIRKIVTYITDHQKNAETSVNLPPVKFGQGATTTQVPMDLSNLMQNAMTAIGGNVQTLIDKLNLIADSAGDIAQNYQTAAQIDQMGVNVIRNELGLPAND